jgi:SAM-dependent methyltransferase
LEWTFDTVSSTYEKFRPGYVRELYEMLFDYLPVGENSRAVEVGIGAGQATLPILQTGCAVTAVEYGANFSQLCREKFREYPKFSVITAKFEDTELGPGAYDLLYSASAFHWIPEEIGYTKAYDLLRSGGAFARFANHPYPDKGRPELSEEIQKLYREYYYPFHRKTPGVPQEFTMEAAEQRAKIAEKYGFTDIRYALFHRTRTFTAAEYRMLLGTYSDHIAIEENIRETFFAKIEEAIHAHGGEITLYDTIDLQLARKP